MTDPQETPGVPTGIEPRSDNSDQHGVSAGQAPGYGTHIITDRDVATLLAARNCLDRLVELAEAVEAITGTMSLHLGRQDGALLASARSTREDVRNLLRRLADDELKRSRP